MKLDKKTLSYIKNTKSGNIDFSSGIIRPNGDYVLTKSLGHLKTLMKELRKPEADIWKEIPEGDSPMFWCIERTGCVTIDHYTSLGMKMTPDQQRTYSLLVKHQIIDDKYYDISSKRQKSK